jgi:hypothetical protein
MAEKIFAGNAFRHRKWEGVYELHLDLATLEQHAMKGAPVNHGSAVVPVLLKHSQSTGKPYVEIDTYKLDYWRKARDGDQSHSNYPPRTDGPPPDDQFDPDDDVPF